MDIAALLGDDAESLLGHVCGMISRSRLTLPGSDFVEPCADRKRPFPAGYERPSAVVRFWKARWHGLCVDPACRPRG